MTSVDLIYKQIELILKDSNINILELFKKIDIELPDNVNTYDIDNITAIGDSELITKKSIIKPIYSEVFENKVIINDGIYAFSFFQKNNALYNKAGVQLGSVINMYDSKNIMPKTFKNADNYVLNPMDNSILKKYIIYPGFQCYHSIEPKKYKLYKYDFNLDKLIPSNIVSIESI